VTIFDAGPALDSLTGFQRRTVEHVAEMFYGPREARRFLVADETGLGKSLVAKGLIAKTIERLQHEPSVKRIDVVYVCSNSDLARQNLAKLDVLGWRRTAIPSRLTLLALHARDLEPEGEAGDKPVNLVSFTPGTSFQQGWATGKAQERALLFLLLQRELQLTGHDRRGAVNLLKAGVGHGDADGGHDRFTRVIADVEWQLDGEPDRAITRAFSGRVRTSGDLSRFQQLVTDIGRRRQLPEDRGQELRALIGRLRGHLSRAGLQVLDPDLVILDEFQRFRELLDPTTEAGDLAHELFDYGRAKVLLLSATPYKPFTYAEESADDHHRDFINTLTFLSAGSGAAESITADLAEYRAAAVSGKPVAELAARLREQLLGLMSRNERPSGVSGGMLEEHVQPVPDLAPEDLVAYVRLNALSERVGGDVSLEYWKSTPYFANFCEGYKLSEQLRRELRGRGRDALVEHVRRLPRLDRGALAARDDVDLGNAKLRALAAQTVDAGWWRLLWMPPSLPYLTPTGPYAEPNAASLTKRLVFSSWAATPTGVASLLSHRAEHLLRLGADQTPTGAETRRLLGYRVEDGRPGAMTTLALFFPMPGLADLGDTLRDAADSGRPVEPASVTDRVTRELRGDAGTWRTLPPAAAAAVALTLDDSVPGQLTAAQATTALSGHSEDETTDVARGVSLHVDEVFRLRGTTPVAELASVAPAVAALAVHSPANIAWRALRRVLPPVHGVTPEGLWTSAAYLAAALRSLFDRPDTILLLEQLDQRGAYWEKVLRYCAAGNLQAVLDEHLHHLSTELRIEPNDDDLQRLASEAADALSLRSATYGAFDPEQPEDPIRLTSRFALRYGGRRQDPENARLPEVRKAFNSPFWPFVLISTSVGQEGIDFHWWCSAVVHWNTPANPVDFEQREGRVDRYSGHAVRRNLAHRHGSAMLRAENPWAAAYELGCDERARLGEFAPHWTYPGPARIERHLMPYPLSVDVTRLERLKADLALYRLTFGQPRQEDMLELLRKRGVQASPERLAELRIDLSPP
jgi:hypothetical protein